MHLYLGRRKGDHDVQFFAHSREGDFDTANWQPLQVHLAGVARLSEEFANTFGAARFGHLLGLWHDLGKYHPKFQERLHGATHRFEHAGAGAVLAVEGDSVAGKLLALAIAGREPGLLSLTGSEASARRGQPTIGVPTPTQSHKPNTQQICFNPHLQNEDDPSSASLCWLVGSPVPPDLDQHSSKARAQSTGRWHSVTWYPLSGNSIFDSKLPKRNSHRNALKHTYYIGYCPSINNIDNMT